MKGGLDKKHGESEGHRRGNLPSFSFRPPFLGLFFFPFPDSSSLFLHLIIPLVSSLSLSTFGTFSASFPRWISWSVQSATCQLTFSVREFGSLWTLSAFDRLIKILYSHLLLFAAFAFACQTWLKAFFMIYSISAASSVCQVSGFSQNSDFNL